MERMWNVRKHAVGTPGGGGIATRTWSGRAALFCALCLYVLLAVVPCWGGVSEFTLVYTTDAHGHIVSDADSIGLDVVAAIAARERNALLVDAGDFLHGLPIAVLTQGRDVVALMKEAGYAAVAVGNHEFDYGCGVLLRRADEAADGPRPVRLLSANVRSGDLPLFDRTLVVERGGLRIGFFGLTPPDTGDLAAVGAVEGLTFDDPEAAARRAVRTLRRAGCDVVVALSHVEIEDSRKLADAVRGIDIIVGGHSHVVADETRNGVRLVSSGKHGEHVGVLTVLYDSELRDVIGTRNRLIAKEDAFLYEPDAELALRLELANAALAERLSEVVAQCDADLIGEREFVRTRETNLGNLTADAMRDAVGADGALMNGGSIRASIARGPVTRRDTLTAFPFGNVVLSKRVTGAQLLDILEHGFGKLPAADGRFPQVSGMVVRVRPWAQPGSRVLSVTMGNGAPLWEHRTYTLAVNDFVADGGDGYPHLQELPVECRAATLEEAFLERLRKDGASAYAGESTARILYE